MNNIIELRQSKKIFTQPTAQELLPVIYGFTEKSSVLAREIVGQINHFKSLNNPQYLPRIKALEKELDEISTKWQSKIARLGAIPKGNWLVDFDNGLGFYCWKFPEKEIKFFHSYDQGFIRRAPVTENPFQQT